MPPLADGRPTWGGGPVLAAEREAMSTVLLGVAVVIGVIVLSPLADLLRLPSPVLLTVYGLVLPVLLRTRELHIQPSLILPIVLPPLLFAATQRSTVHEFRESARPILVLAVGLTVASAALGAWVAHLAGFGWGPAWVLGAVVAPPDPVAATAVARRLRLPDRLVTVLEGEGMFNDATALVLYAVAVGAVVRGQLTLGDVGIRLLLALVAGTGIGLLAGLLTRWSLSVLHDPATETTVTIAVPFAAYQVAETLHGSGVLAVLTLGLFLRSYGHPVLTSGGWLLGRAVWRFADYLITSVVFVLIGFELTAVLRSSAVGAAPLRLALVVVAALVVLRFVWLFPAVALARATARRRDSSTPYGAKETTVAAWAGMRGVVTVATVLAVPLVTQGGGPFPDRAEIVFVGLVCVLLTLVVQGLTLPPLIRLLGVGTGDDSGAEVTQLRARAARAALEELRNADKAAPDAARRAAVLQYEAYLAAQAALTSARGTGADAAQLSEELAVVLRQAAEVERAVVLSARRRGEVTPRAADEVLADIEARAVRDVE